MKIYSVILILVFASIATIAIEPARKIRENHISTVKTDGMVTNSFTVSNDLRRIAFQLKKDNRQCVVVDGIEGPVYDEVGPPVFSPDNQHFVYSAHSDNNWYIVTDHKNVQMIETGAVVSAQFTPDNKSIVYVLNDNNKYRVVVGNKKSNDYDYIDENSLTFSADGSKMAFSASNANRQFIVFDGNEGTPYEQVGYPIISNNGKHFAYWGVADNKSYVILDEHESRSYDAVSSIIFNKQGSSCAYHAERDGKHIIVVDGQESEPYEVAHSLQFSPDGAHIAYGIEVPGTVNENGTVVEDDEDESTYRQYAVLDGNKIGPYQTVVEGGFIFSNDGKQFAFKASKHDEFFMVLDKKEGTHYGNVLQATLTFSADNKLVFAAERDYKRLLNNNGIESAPFNDIYTVKYSPDNSVMAYSVKNENKEFVVVNGNKGKAYDTIMGLGAIHFDTPDTFHYISMTGEDIFLVEETITK